MNGVNWAYNPDAETLAYWADVRKRIDAGKPANPNPRPHKTLKQQAAAQIARLEREIEEWKAIMEKGDE